MFGVPTGYRSPVTWVKAKRSTIKLPEHKMYFGVSYEDPTRSTWVTSKYAQQLH